MFNGINSNHPFVKNPESITDEDINKFQRYLKSQGLDDKVSKEAIKIFTKLSNLSSFEEDSAINFIIENIILRKNQKIIQLDKLFK
jgi:hypothetical protein